jgi:hypothetical protein
MTGQTHDPPSSSRSSQEPEEPLVVLEFSSFEDFLVGCSSRISAEGLFLEVEPRERVSALLLFELRIRDGFRLLKGEGEVVRVHDPLPTSDEPAGLTIKFTSLDEASQRLLPVVLGHYEKRGIPLLDLELETPAVEVEVTSEQAPAEDAAEVTLDDLWEEFEVVAGHQTDVATEEEAGRSVAPEAKLVEADQFGGGVEVETSGEEVEARGEEPEPVAEAEETEDTGTAAVAVAEDVSYPDEPGTETAVELPPDDALDLVGVLPTPPGAETDHPGDLGLPPDDPSEPEAEPARSWWQRWEVWLLLLMAVLGISIGLMVYLRYINGGDWPFFSQSLPDERAAPETRVAERTAVPEDRDIIAAFTFEDPDRLGEPSRVSKSPSEKSSPPVTGRGRPAPEAPERQAGPPPERVEPLSTPPGLLTGVDRITWQESQEQTILTLWGDGPFDTDQLVVFRLDTGTPRQVVKILGVSRPFSERNLTVGTSHVSTVRTGLHTGDVGQELHVVADLEDPEVRMRRVEPEGSQLHVYFSRL